MINMVVQYYTWPFELVSMVGLRVMSAKGQIDQASEMGGFSDWSRF
jgi:hypothetical protein